MVKPTTLKNNLIPKNTPAEIERTELNGGSVSEGPTQETVDLLLNYSKALKTTKTESLGDVFTVLN